MGAFWAERPESVSGADGEGLDLADQPLERLRVVRRRLLGDNRPEAELKIWRQPLRELFGRAVPERVVVLDSGHRRPVVLEGGLPDLDGLGLRVADRRLDPERE